MSRARQQDGDRRDEQVAGRDDARLGPADRDGPGGEGARRRAVESALRQRVAVVRRRAPRTTARAVYFQLRATRIAASASEAKRSQRARRGPPASAPTRPVSSAAVGRNRVTRSARDAGATDRLDLADGERRPAPGRARPASRASALRSPRIASRLAAHFSLRTSSASHARSRSSSRQRAGKRLVIGRARLRSATARVKPISEIGDRHAAKRGDAVRVPEPDDHERRRCQQREREGEHGRDGRERDCAIARARASSSSTEASSSRVRTTPPATRRRLRQRAAQAAARPSGRAVGHGGEGHERRFSSRPTTRPTAAAMPIACHGWSCT